MVLTAICLVVVYFVKYLMLNWTILLASEKVHDKMVDAVLHCPAGYFDTTPSGILINKFSNDLGMIDYSLFFPLNYSVEGPIAVGIAIVNIGLINAYIMIPSAIVLIASIAFFKYSRPVIIKCKELDLQTKNSIFSFFGETVGGITQIRVFQRVKERLKSFSVIVNKATKATFAYDLVTRGFAFNSTVLTILLMFAGLCIGLISVNPDLYAVTVIYLITINELLFALMREIIHVESSMVSAERILELEHLSREKEFRAPYD